MNRRNFVSKLGLSALAVPVIGKAEQQPSQAALDAARREGAEQSTKEFAGLMSKLVEAMKEAARRGEVHKAITFAAQTRAIVREELLAAQPRIRIEGEMHRSPNIAPSEEG